MQRITLLCYHSCPTAKLGQRDAGGMNLYVRHSAQELARAGVEVDIFTRRHNAQDPIIAEIAPGVRLIHIDAGPLQAPKEELEQYLSLFSHNLQEFVEREGRRYDLVHSHYWLSGQVGLGLAQCWGIPHIATFHTLAEIKRLVQGDGVDPAQRSGAERLIATNTDAIVVSDQHESEALVRLYGAPIHRIRVIPCGVDTALFRPGDQQKARNDLGLDGPPALLFVGRLDPLKGMEVLLHIVAAIEEPKPQVLIVGGDPETEAAGLRLAALAAELGLSERIHFTGIIPHDKLPTYYNAAEALVMPSYYESFGLVALEAMACGLPVVAARVGALASLVKDWDTGCLIAGHCPEPFAQRLESLLRHPNLRNSLGQAAWRYAQEFSWERVAQETLSLYQELQSARFTVTAGRRP